MGGGAQWCRRRWCKNGLIMLLNAAFPFSTAVPDLDLDLDLDPDPDSLQERRTEKGGVVSSCLPHFLPSTPALIGNLGGPVYLHG